MQTAKRHLKINKTTQTIRSYFLSAIFNTSKFRARNPNMYVGLIVSREYMKFSSTMQRSAVPRAMNEVKACIALTLIDLQSDVYFAKPLSGSSRSSFVSISIFFTPGGVTFVLTPTTGAVGFPEAEVFREGEVDAGMRVG